MEKPKSKYGERFVKVKAVIKTWTEVKDIIEYDTRCQQFIIPSNYQLDCKVISWSYINE